MSKWSIETHTRMIIKVQQAQIRLNLLIGLRRLKWIISHVKSDIGMNRNLYYFDVRSLLSL